jgi:hypothetical protein
MLTSLSKKKKTPFSFLEQPQKLNAGLVRSHTPPSSSVEGGDRPLPPPSKFAFAIVKRFK